MGWPTTKSGRRPPTGSTGFWANSAPWHVGNLHPTGPADVERLDSTIVGAFAYFYRCRLYMGSKLGEEVDWAARRPGSIPHGVRNVPGHVSQSVSPGRGIVCSTMVEQSQRDTCAGSRPKRR